MKNSRKRLNITLSNGIYRVPADFENGFHLVPTPNGIINLAFWDKDRLKVFIRNFGFYPVIKNISN